VKDAAQDVAGDVSQDVRKDLLQDLASGPGRHAPFSPRHHRRRRSLCAARDSLRLGRNWAAQWHLARAAVGKRFRGCRARRLYVHLRRQERRRQPGQPSTGPTAEVLLEGAEYDAETKDAAKASKAEAAVVARVRPPRPIYWSVMTRGHRRNSDWNQQITSKEAGHVRLWGVVDSTDYVHPGLLCAL